MTITRAVDPLSVCDKQLDDTFSNFLIYCTRNWIVQDEDEDDSTNDDEWRLQSHCHNNDYNDTMGLECFQPTKSSFWIQVGGKDNQRDNNHNRSLSFQKMEISQMINGIGSFVDYTFRFNFFFSKIRSRNVLIMFVGSYFYKPVYVIKYDSTH